MVQSNAGWQSSRLHAPLKKPAREGVNDASSSLNGHHSLGFSTHRMRGRSTDCPVRPHKEDYPQEQQALHKPAVQVRTLQ